MTKRDEKIHQCTLYTVTGSWILDTGYCNRILDIGYWILDSVYWTLDTGQRALDTGHGTGLIFIFTFVVVETNPSREFLLPFRQCLCAVSEQVGCLCIFSFWTYCSKTCTCLDRLHSWVIGRERWMSSPTPESDNVSTTVWGMRPLEISSNSKSSLSCKESLVSIAFFHR
jgi:hypothetical protein